MRPTCVAQLHRPGEVETQPRGIRTSTPAMTDPTCHSGLPSTQLAAFRWGSRFRTIIPTGLTVFPLILPYLIFTLCTCYLSTFVEMTPTGVMLALSFEVTSPAHKPGKGWTGGGRCPSPHHSNVACMAATLHTFPLTRDMTLQRGPSWHQGTEPLTVESQTLD